MMLSVVPESSLAATSSAITTTLQSLLRLSMTGPVCLSMTSDGGDDDEEEDGENEDDEAPIVGFEEASASFCPAGVMILVSL